jgi:3-methylcrotonyl-CoA carboxylase alpha subunit
MIAKLIATGENRDAARRRALEALRRFPVLGVRTNIPFLIRILEHPRFVSGDIDTHFIAAERRTLRETPERLSEEVRAVAAAVESGRQLLNGSTAPDPWQTLRGTRV